MTADTSAWQRLGRLLIQRRAALDPAYRNRRRFTAAVGLSYRVIYDVEEARRVNFGASTLAAIESAYRLVPGSIGRILSGGDPEPLPGAAEVARPEEAWPRPGEPDRRTTRKLPVLHAGVNENALKPFLEAVEAAVRAATPPGGGWPSGAEVWPDNPVYQRVWDSELLGEQEKIRTVAISWMIASEAARTG